MLQRTGSPRWRGVGFTVGAVLLIGAVAFALTRTDFSPLRNARPVQILDLAAAVVANLLLAGTLFWVVTLSFDAVPPVRWARMVAVVCASGLLNYLPMQAGSIGRAAYLKLRHGLPVRQSVIILAIVAAVTVAAPVLCVVALAVAPGTNARFVAAAVAVVIAGACAGPIAQRVIRRPMVAAWSWLPLRGVDLFVTSLRMWVAFAAVGRPITYAEALGVAAGVVVVNMLSFTPNGLGVREWSVAVMAGLIWPSLAVLGVLATLLDRAVEAVVLVIAGVWGMGRLRGSG